MSNNFELANTLIKQGDEKYNNNDQKGALLAYKSAAEIAPNYYLPFLKGAQVKVTSNNVDLMLEAYSDFTKVIELEPSNTEAYVGRGALGMSLSPDDPSSLDDFNKALELGSNDFMLYWNIGIFKFQKNDFGGMLSAFTELLKLPIDQNTKGEALYFKALANMRLGEYGIAIIDFTNALSNNVKQNLVWTYFNRAICYQRINNINKAIQDINAFLKVQPNHIEALQFRAQIFEVLNRVDEAVKDFTSIIEQDNVNKNALIQRSKILFMSGRDGEALQDYLTLMKLDPQDEIYSFSAGVCLTQLEKLEEAINYYNIAININSRYAAAYHYRGLCYLHLGNNQACNDFNIAYKLGFEESKDYIDKYCV